MKNQLSLILLSVIIIGSSACFSNKGKGKSKLPLDDGQLHGVAPSSKKSLGKPLGMVYIPPGTFHMGPSDEDINFNYSARNRQVSVPGFWMDATEITNNDYRAFVWWVRDSLAAKELGFFKSAPGGGTGGDSAIAIDWIKARTIKYDASN